ncbi:peritrophin-44-like [Musca autumnalis]|uniref:peritrophin-44-like n=1 Tax=Musca autumnalis TaxID=221902 RepID=UPI003CF54DB6
MKALSFVPLAFILSLCLVAPHATIAADVSSDQYVDLCRLFKDHTLISVPGSCDEYIECHTSGEATIHHCGSSKSFDVSSQKCVDMKSSSNTLCHNRCEGKNGVWVADPTNCHGYFYCLNGEPHWGPCPDSMHFSEKQQMCVYTKTSECIDVSSICELVPDKTQFRDEKDCGYYYECSKGVQSRKACSKKFYDVQAQKCVEKSEVVCNAHPIPDGICSKNKNKPYKSDQATCRGYFYCRDLGIVDDLEPLWGQCPEGKFFSEADQACVNPVDIKCEYNRCDGRGNQMVSSANNNCHNYIICQDGAPVEEKTCIRDYFFDEQYQACVPDIIYYECCDIK